MSDFELYLSQAKDVHELEHLQRAWERRNINKTYWKGNIHV